MTATTAIIALAPVHWTTAAFAESLIATKSNEAQNERGIPNTC